MMNVADAIDELEDEYYGTGTDGDCFAIVNDIDADGYDTDTSQYMGAVSLINTSRKQFKGLTPRETKEDILARTAQSQMGNPRDRKYKHMVSVNSLKKSQYNPSILLMPYMSLVH